MKMSKTTKLIKNHTIAVDGILSDTSLIELHVGFTSVTS